MSCPASLRASTLLALFTACCLIASTSIAANPWWQDAVFYEVFVRSFYDSDGDGRGDLQGLIEKLDYLNDGDPETSDDLGVTALWLMPIQPSPSYHGYDVTDYYAIDPDYGTLDDFRALLRATHERGMRVILDLVLNHTSNLHPWFLASRQPESPFRDWYLWTETPPEFLGPWGQTVWHRTGPSAYYGLFWSGMPDLDYRNPEVTMQVFDIARFWLDEIGVDGFRLDAIRHLIEDGEIQENTPATHFWLKGFHAVAKGWKPDALLVGEIWDEPEAILPYLDREVDLAFEFSLADAILNGLRWSNARPIASALRTIQTVYPTGRYATFLSNHDQDRVMTRLIGNVPRAKLAASILLTLPGTPFLYYGEEIGLTGAKPDERIRTPMAWTDGEYGGFTTGRPWEPLESGAPSRSVAIQSEDTDSLLWHYRRMIALRMDTRALRTGSLTLLETGDGAVLAYLRECEDEILLVIHHLAGRAQETPLRITLPGLPAGAVAIQPRLGDPDIAARIGAQGEPVVEIRLAGYETAVLDLKSQ